MVRTSPRASRVELYARYDRCFRHLAEARLKFLPLDGVLGVGCGLKETAGRLLPDQPAILVYVAAKKPRNAVRRNALIPPEFKGVPTDVVVPWRRAARKRRNHDFMWLDWGKIHARNPARDVGLAPTADYDLDHVAVLEIDDTFIIDQNGTLLIDWVKAVKRFLQAHPDVFDFITFYLDTASGLPYQGSWHYGVYNKTKGINYYAGSNLNQRGTYGSATLRAFHSIGGFGNSVLLQETGHMWGAYVRNRDTENGARQYDLLIGTTPGNDIYHWGRFFDDDHSPMDYDGIDWEELGGNQFAAHGVEDDFFHFCPLDLYLMGLSPAGQVGPFYVIQDPSDVAGTITGTKKDITVQNVIWAEGDRDPAYPETQRVWKHAFVLLTYDAWASHGMAQDVAAQRRRYTWQFYKATRFLGNADTSLRPYTLFPAIRDVSLAADDDRAIVGWKTSLGTRGRVNFATSPAAFRRDQAHTEPFSTAQESSFGTTHGLLLTGLSPNTTYYFEILAETEDGLFDRNGVEALYTRKTNDTCAPDINNVLVRRSRFLGSYKVTVTWKTDEPSDSRIYYGNSVPPGQQAYDPYPTTDHRIRLKNLPAGTSYISVESRDAAGNVTLDDNGGNYYQVQIPAIALSALEATTPKEIVARIEDINTAIAAADLSGAATKISQLVVDVVGRELGHIARTSTLPGEDIDAGYEALTLLIGRLDGTARVVERGGDFIDFAVDPEPLSLITCIDLPTDAIAQRSVYPVLPRLLSGVRPRVILEPHPSRGPGYYRLRRA